MSRRGKLVVGDPYFTAGTALLLDRKGLGDASPGDLVVARRTRGRARVERVLGSAKTIEAVLKGLLVETGALQEFEPYVPPEPSLEGRVDLRELPTFTIDPETAKDFDDALSIGDDRAYVHIADVGAFVPAGSPLDHGAARRGFSTYVPGLVAPMLPHELADELCSLRPYVDRLCVTVELPFDGDASFYRSVIRSDARLSYGQAERMLAGEEPFELLDVLRRLDERARELRRRRFARGALRIQTPEVAFEFDGRGGVTAARRESEPQAHALVEEFMILANEAVARLLASRNRAALYRVHERPDPQSVALLLAKLADLEVPTPPTPDADHLTPQEAEALAAQTAGGVADYVEHSGRGRDAFPALVLRALMQARYDPRNLGHSGLASRAYCHFTSPIRRYPDLVVHRALLSELGAAGPVVQDLEDLAVHVSAREREAAQIEYQADEMCLAWLLDSVLYEEGWEAAFTGEIVGVIGSGIFVRFADVFEGFLPARRLPGDYFEPTPLGTALAGRRGGGTFRLGDPIEVRVERIERTSGQVELSPA